MWDHEFRLGPTYMFYLYNWLNILWHRFNTVLTTYLRDFGLYWHESIKAFLQICRLHIHDVNLPFSHIPKVLCWIVTWWLRRLTEFKKPLWGHFSFVTWCVILLAAAIRRWVCCGHKGMAMTVRSAVVLNNDQLILRGPKCAKKILPQHSVQWIHPTRQDEFTLSYCLHLILIKPENIFPIFYCAILVSLFDM